MALMYHLLYLDAQLFLILNAANAPPFPPSLTHTHKGVGDTMTMEGGDPPGTYIQIYR